MNHSWALLFAISFTACTPIPTPSPDWAQHTAGSCEQAGAVLELHSCPEYRPRGTTWLAFCSQAQASAGAIDLDVGCIAGAGSLEAVRACHARCRNGN